MYDEYARPSFDLYIKGEKKERISLGVQGEHNVYNALGAIAVAMESGAGLEAAGRGLLKFTGTNRRFEKKGELKGITIIDDIFEEIKMVFFYIKYNCHGFRLGQSLRDDTGDNQRMVVGHFCGIHASCIQGGKV